MSANSTMTLSTLLNVKHCAKCGKEFCAAPEHVFADKAHGRYWCSWTCFSHRKEFNRIKNIKQVEQLTLDGESVKIFQSAEQAAAYYGRHKSGSIRQACREGTSYNGYLWRYVEEKKHDQT